MKATTFCTELEQLHLELCASEEAPPSGSLRLTAASRGGVLNSSFLLLDLYKLGPCFMFGSSPELAKIKGKLASKLSKIRV